MSRMSARLVRLLEVDKDRWWYVPDLAAILGTRRLGSLYPALAELEADAAIESRWDEADPRRRRYRLAPIRGPREETP